MKKKYKNPETIVCPLSGKACVLATSGQRHDWADAKPYPFNTEEANNIEGTEEPFSSDWPKAGNLWTDY